jgi:alpha-acetolactate decarboxylase
MKTLSEKLCQVVMVLLAGVGTLPVSADEGETWDGKLVQYGKMHEAIGQQQHQGRVQLKKLLERPHFFGVAALEQLAGEATIYDGKVTLTRVDDAGKLKAQDSEAVDAQATLLVGAYVPAWSEHPVKDDVAAEKFDQYIATSAKTAGVKSSSPFVFTVEGEFSNLRLHVIHGACPLHARLRKISLPADKRPLEVELPQVKGRLVGVFARDAVGNITHPDTSTHMHLLFTDSESKRLMTGHVEQVGIQKGAVVRFPK